MPVRARRSRCPVACKLDVLGDRWSLLVVRDLMRGKRRFVEFLSSPEAIPTNILADRLRRLVANGILTKQPKDAAGKAATPKTAKKPAKHRNTPAKVAAKGAVKKGAKAPVKKGAKQAAKKPAKAPRKAAKKGRKAAARQPARKAKSRVR